MAVHEAGFLFWEPLCFFMYLMIYMKMAELIWKNSNPLAALPVQMAIAEFQIDSKLNGKLILINNKGDCFAPLAITSQL